MSVTFWSDNIIDCESETKWVCDGKCKDKMDSKDDDKCDTVPCCKLYDNTILTSKNINITNYKNIGILYHYYTNTKPCSMKITINNGNNVVFNDQFIEDKTEHSENTGVLSGLDYQSSIQIAFITQSDGDCRVDSIRVYGIPSIQDITLYPSEIPTNIPTQIPSINPIRTPTELPTDNPSINPTLLPTFDPTFIPTNTPTSHPTFNPSNFPSIFPTYFPTPNPTINPTINSIINATINATVNPTSQPTKYSLTNSIDTSGAFNNFHSSTSLHLGTAMLVSGSLLCFVAIFIMCILLYCHRKYKRPPQQQLSTIDSILNRVKSVSSSSPRNNAVILNVIKTPSNIVAKNNRQRSPLPLSIAISTDMALPENDDDDEMILGWLMNILLVVMLDLLLHLLIHL